MSLDIREHWLSAVLLSDHKIFRLKFILSYAFIKFAAALAAITIPISSSLGIVSCLGHLLGETTLPLLNLIWAKPSGYFLQLGTIKYATAP